MLVAKEHKKLLMNLREPEQVMAIIPGAQMQTIKGKQIVSVPHTQDIVRVLRNLGLSAPGPIRSYYDWPGMYKPFVHQLETAEFCTLNPRAFVLNDMGTGKTLSVLWAFDWLQQLQLVRSALIISPLSTLERTWGDEIFRHFPTKQFYVLHGTAEKRRRLLESPADIYIINHDGIKDPKMLKLLCEKPGLDLIIIDELAIYRNSSTDKWKALNTLVNGNVKLGYKPKDYVWGLTGTPIPNEPTDAWAQCKLLRPEGVDKYYSGFRDRVMRQITQYKWMPREDALKTVHGVMQPAIRFSREECIDLPPTTYITSEVPLTVEQARMYKDMLTRLKAEFEGGQVTAVNEAVKLNKLVQICVGRVYTQDGEVAIPAYERIKQTVGIIEEAGSKVIVFVPLTGALNYLVEEIGKYFDVRAVHGGVSKAQRDQIFHDFMQPNGPRVLIAQPGTMSHGLTLTAANTIVWFAPITSAEIYQQANARIVRPGQTKNTLIVRLQGSEVERRMYDRLERRESTQGVLLSMFD